MADREQVRRWLGDHVEDRTDMARGLSSRLLRSRRDDTLRVGLGGEAGVDDHLHALLDLLAWHHYEVASGTHPGNRVQLLIGRGPYTDSAREPLRTLVAAHAGAPKIELLVESENEAGQPTEPDTDLPPAFDDERSSAWAAYLTSWYATAPGALAREIIRSSPQGKRMRLYPQLSKSPAEARWSLRLNGLQIGLVGSEDGVLQVGAGESSSQKAVQAWRSWSDGGKEFPFTLDSVGDAIARIDHLVAALPSMGDGLLDHGVPEHALESAVVSGQIPVSVGGRVLRPIEGDEVEVAYGSQIPTQWSIGSVPRYLDALLHDGNVPWAMEMKVASAGGGYGAYLRHAIGQAVLYRHFLRTAPGYRSWLTDRGLDAGAVRGAVLYPEPTDDVRRKIAQRIGNLLLTASAFDIQVITVDAGWIH